jgi:hypothetical protein
LQNICKNILTFFSNQPPMLQEGIIMLTIHQHELPIMIFQVQSVADLIKVKSSQAILPAEVIQGKPVLTPPSAGVLHDVSHKSQVPVINLYPGLGIAIHLLSVE